VLPTFRFRAPAILAFTVILAACDAKLDVDAPAPAMMADIDTLPTLPTSTLDIPLTYDLTPVVRALESAVPRKFGDIDERKQLSNKRMQIAFEATRDPFTVSLDGETARISAVIHYKGRGFYNPRVGPNISARAASTTSDHAPASRSSRISLLPPSGSSADERASRTLRHTARSAATSVGSLHSGSMSPSGSSTRQRNNSKNRDR
jgi:hypothetical protein